MGSIWFKPDNLAAKLETGHVNSAYIEGIYASKKMVFQALVYIDSSNALETVPILFINAIDTVLTQLTIESGILTFKSWDRTTLKVNVNFQEAIAFDELIEIEMIFNSSKYPYVFAKLNGTSLTLDSYQATNNHYMFYEGGAVTLGGINDQLPQAKGLLINSAKLTNDNNMPSDTYANYLITRWDWDFEDEANPFKIVTRRNGTVSEVTAYVDYQPENVVWTEGIEPPADTGGGEDGGGGGIVVPGNGNTTQVQGIITENDLPVARRVFAITEAELTIDASEEATQAVLDNTVSNELDGSYTLDTSPYEGSVMVVAMDDYGSVWQPDTAYSVGEVIRPPNFQGYVYHCNLAGTTDSTEPVWWFDTESTQTVGTAQFQAKPFSRPLAHGPLIPKIIPSE